MKKLKLTIGITAFAAGIAGAFAFSPKPVKQMSAEYYVNPDGTPTGELVNPSKPCGEINDVACSATFTVVNGQPTGNGSNIKNGPRPL